jgi:Amt family ammonium transporter
MMFQGMFAIISVALWTGGVVERIKFSAFLLFAVLWFTFVYCPVAHWVWGDGGWLARLGALDFAGGTVVHVNAGMTALALALLLRPRKGFKEGQAMEPSNIPLVVLGAGLLWFGWFGFNAGSALGANGLAAQALMVTTVSAAAGVLTWVGASYLTNRKVSVVGAAAGAVAGLVAITPAAGFVTVGGALVLGLAAGAICFGVTLLRERLSIDDSLDVFAVHGVGGMLGAVGVGVLAVAAIGGASGLIEGNVEQLGIQIVATLFTIVFAGVGTFVIIKVIDLVIGLRVPEAEEEAGLDVAVHGETAYVPWAGTADGTSQATAAPQAPPATEAEPA